MFRQPTTVIFGASGCVGTQLMQMVPAPRVAACPTGRCGGAGTLNFGNENELAEHLTVLGRTRLIVVVGARSANPRDVWDVDARYVSKIATAASLTNGTVEHVLLLSGACVETPIIPLQYAKLAGERAIRALPIRHTIVRLTSLYKCFDATVAQAARRGVVYEHPDQAPFRPLTCAAVASHLATESRASWAHNRTYTLGGDVVVRQQEIAQSISTRTGARVSRPSSLAVSTITGALWLASWVSTRADAAYRLAELVNYYSRYPMEASVLLRGMTADEYVQSQIACVEGRVNSQCSL